MQLQNVMADYSRRKGICGFFADILPKNLKMKKLARSMPNASIKSLGDVLEVTVLFWQGGDCNARPAEMDKEVDTRVFPTICRNNRCIE